MCSALVDFSATLSPPLPARLEHPGALGHTRGLTDGRVEGHPHSLSLQFPTDLLFTAGHPGVLSLDSVSRDNRTHPSTRSLITVLHKARTFVRTRTVLFLTAALRGSTWRTIAFLSRESKSRRTCRILSLLKLVHGGKGISKLFNGSFYERVPGLP